MRRALVVAALAALALAAPAGAAMSPPPAVLSFEGLAPSADVSEAYAGAGAHLSTPESCSDVSVGRAATAECAFVDPRGHDSPQGLFVEGFAWLDVTFDAKQAGVSMWVSALGSDSESNRDDVTVQAWPGAPGEGEPLFEKTITADGTDSPFGRPAVLQEPVGAPLIGSVRAFTGDDPRSERASGFDFLVDDITFSPQPSPDTDITSAPPAVSRSTDATFVFIANQADTGFTCTLDGAASACRPPFTAPAGAGPHTFTVAAKDRFGTTDGTPASYTWTVDLSPLAAAAAPPPLPPPDGDRDGVPDARDNCPANANANQADLDADGVGDACETAPPGNVAPVNGRNVIVRVLSGDIFVKLPATTSRRLAQAAPIPGFVPLKGVASLPVGTVVDARKGRLAMESTVDGRRIGEGGRTQSATLAAGIFRIRQQRIREGSKTRVPTDLVLQSAPGAEAACAHTPAEGPIKGRPHNTVRSLAAAVQKGVFRVVGAAGISSSPNAVWVTEDRCDGTRTDVGKGRVSVFDRVHKRTVTVRPGRSLLVRARLFAARRERR